MTKDSDFKEKNKQFRVKLINNNYNLASNIILKPKTTTFLA